MLCMWNEGIKIHFALNEHFQNCITVEIITFIIAVAVAVAMVFRECEIFVSFIFSLQILFMLI